MRKMMGVVVVGVLSSVVFAPVHASADGACPMERVPETELRRHEGELLELINRERISRGLEAIAVDAAIDRIARDHAGRMAESGRVYHNPNYEDASRVGAEHVGEVPANGCSVRGVHDLVMGSPADRATVLVPEWSEGGVGIASNDAGKLFVVEAFAQPMRAPAPMTAARVEPPPPSSNPTSEAPPTTPASSPERAAVDERPAQEASAVEPPDARVRVDAMPFRGIEEAPRPVSPRTDGAQVGLRSALAGWATAGLLVWSVLWALVGPGGPGKWWARRLG